MAADLVAVGSLKLGPATGLLARTRDRVTINGKRVEGLATSQNQRPAELDGGDLVLYQEICRSHAAIADFRAKLLALIPIATGAGAFSVLGKFSDDHHDRDLLAPIGLVGFAFAFGLFVYELRGIEDCTMLRERARKIEEKHGVAPERGHFGKWPPGKFDLIDEVGAGWIVYTSVLATWAFVAVRGFAVLSLHYQVLTAICAAAYVVLLSVALSMRLGRRIWHYDENSADRRIDRVERTNQAESD